MCRWTRGWAAGKSPNALLLTVRGIGQRVTCCTSQDEVATTYWWVKLYGGVSIISSGPPCPDSSDALIARSREHAGRRHTRNTSRAFSSQDMISSAMMGRLGWSVSHSKRTQGPRGPHQVPGGAGGGGTRPRGARVRTALGLPGCASALPGLPGRQLLVRARRGRHAAARRGQRAGERLGSPFSAELTLTQSSLYALLWT